MKNRYEEKLFDIVIFTWEEWDQLDIDCFQFYNVEFPFESMKQYNGCDCSLDREGKLCIYENNVDLIWENYICQIPEFMEELNKKYNG